MHTPPAAPHNCCLPLYVASGPRDTTKDPHSHCSHCRYPTMHTKNHSCHSCGLLWPDPKRYHAPTPALDPELPRPPALGSLWHYRVTTLPCTEDLSLPESVHEVCKKWLFLQLCKHLHKTTRVTKDWGIMTPPKEHIKLPVTDPKWMEIIWLSNKEFKMIILKLLKRTQMNNIRKSGKQYRNKTIGSIQRQKNNPIYKSIKNNKMFKE